jgi:hypothetical protein
MVYRAYNYVRAHEFHHKMYESQRGGRDENTIFCIRNIWMSPKLQT